MKPKVSFVIPTWNNGHIIQNALTSLLGQTEKNWEAVIVDDGSDDHTYFVIKQFDDPRIRYFKKEHEGLVVARNYGIERAQADIIATQDSDDLSLPDRIEKSLKQMNKTKCDILIHAGYMNSWNPIFGAISRIFLPANKATKAKIVKEQYLPGFPLFKKSVWEKKPFRLETQFAYDWMMWIDWILGDFKVANLNVGLYEYVRVEHSASQEFEKSGERAASMEKIREILKKEYGVS